jgi:hypothetical protein
MRRRAQQRLILLGQVLIVAGLGLAAIWNTVSALFRLPNWGWWGAMSPIPGLALWLGALAVPRLLAAAAPAQGETYRLVYDAPEGWRDDAARRALLSLASSAGLAMAWAKDGAPTGGCALVGDKPDSYVGTGCWLLVPEGWGGVLERMVADVFPGGQVELDELPAPGPGVVVLRWQGDVPFPHDLCRLEGVDGVLYRPRGREAATVALWGAGAGDALFQLQLARRGDVEAAQGEGLRRPPFVGDNPWPDWPVFPPSQSNPGLAAVSRLERLEPALRVTGRALVTGRDAEDAPLGFDLPDLAGARFVWAVGQAAGQASINLAAQAIRGGVPTLFLDGSGTAVSGLVRRLTRDVAEGRVLACDVERPAQTRFRLNPLWLPAAPEAWPRALPLWLDWLRELGVTPGGLGRAAYRHTQVSVVLAALVAAGQGVAIDPPGLRSALDVADFLSMVELDTLPADPRPLLGEETWTWWQTEGRATPPFDVQLHLGHLRDHLNALMGLPEYGVLWRAPYLDPLAALNAGVTGLLWRLPDPRRRLRVYTTSQLLALATLLAAWPADRPLVVVLHELEAGEWISALQGFGAARLIVATRQASRLPARELPATLLVSRLDKGDAETVQARFFAGVRAADLRRLPETRLLFWQNKTFATVEMAA